MNWPCEVNKLGRDTVLADRALRTAIVADNEFRRNMADTLRRAAVVANMPGIKTADVVAVSFDTGHVSPVYVDEKRSDKVQLSDDLTLVIFVEGLFERADRSDDDRSRFAQKLLKEASKLLPVEWKVEVFVTRFDPTVDSFAKSH
jgi:hypothetical protein